MSKLPVLINAVGSHAINFYHESAVEFDKDARKLQPRAGAKPFATIPPSGIVLNAKREAGVLETARFRNGQFPTRTDIFPSVDEPPNGKDSYIVSFLYASAARAAGRTETLYTVTGTVFDETGRPCGCLAIQPVP